jgi:hypothetical protein
VRTQIRYSLQVGIITEEAARILMAENARREIALEQIDIVAG